MKFSRLLPVALVAAIAFAACDDDTTSNGSSLVQDKVEIIEDTTFVLTAECVDNPTIMSRTITQLLGDLDAVGFGRLKSDIVTQFMPSSYLDTTGVAPSDVDSVRMLMFIENGAFTGDSLVPMGVKVYKLNKQLPSPIYSTFDPTDYYDPADVFGQTIYTANALHNDSIQNLDYRTITVTLPREFGVALFEEYRRSPETFTTPEGFANWFPGLYITNSFGKGRVVNISETRINVHYKRHAKVEKDSVEVDTVYESAATYMAVTPEVVTNNNLSLKLAPQLMERRAQGEKLITAPTGTDVEIKLPIAEMISTYKQNGGSMAVFNTFEIKIPTEEIANDYSIKPPTYLLMVLKSKRDEFFAKNQLPDSKTSFYTSYSSYSNCYNFTGLRQYFIDLLEKEGEITDEDCTFVLTPVNISWTESSSYGTSYMESVAPYISGPAMVKLDVDNAKIKMIYSKQNLNF